MHPIIFQYVLHWRHLSVSDTQLNCSHVTFRISSAYVNTFIPYLHLIFIQRLFSKRFMYKFLFEISCGQYFHRILCLHARYSSITCYSIWWKWQLRAMEGNLCMLQTNAWTVSVLHMLSHRWSHNVVWRFPAHKCVHLRIL